MPKKSKLYTFTTPAGSKRILNKKGEIWSTDKTFTEFKTLKYIFKNGDWWTTEGRPAKALSTIKLTLKKQLAKLGFKYTKNKLKTPKPEKMKKQRITKSPAKTMPIVDRISSRKKDTPYDEALKVSKRLKKLLEKNSFTDIIVCGSIRRKKKTVGDIDLMAKGALQKLKKIKELEVIKGGNATVTYLFEGIQVNHYVYKDLFAGGMKLFLTGPGKYNESMRRFAKKKQFKLSQYGLFKNDRRIASKTEKAIYKKLGIPYDKPTDRKKDATFETYEIPWDIINKTPKKYIKTNSLDELVQIKKVADDIYYNDPEKSKLSDKAYDILINAIEKLDPNNKTLKEVRAPIRQSSSNLVKLPWRMPGLDQLKNEAMFNKFISEYETIVASDKADGISIGIQGTKEGNKVFRAGNSDYAEDISFISKVLKLPKLKPNTDVRAEFVIDDAVMKKHFQDAKGYSRNTAGGILNRTKNVNPNDIKKGKLVAYELISPRKKPSEQFKTLKQLGFNVVPYKVFESPTWNEIEKYLTKRKKKSPYEIDGLVLAANIKTNIPKSGNPKTVKKFKINLKSDYVDVTVKEIEWNVTKHNVWQPRVIVEPTKVGKVMVRHFSGFNAYFIKTGKRKHEDEIGKDMPLGPGAVVRVVHSGNVIPHIISIVKAAKKPQMPSGKYKWDSEGTKLLVDGGNTVGDIKKLAAFIRIIGMEEFSEASLKKLYEGGFDDVESLITATEQDLIELPGFGKKKANSFVTQIRNALDGIQLHTLMKASGCFGPLIGETRIKKILKEFPTVLTKRPKNLVSKIAKMSGFKENTAIAFEDGLDRFDMFWKKIKKYCRVEHPGKIKSTGKKLQGQVVTFTEVRDKQLMKRIEEEGGEAITSWKNAVTILIAGNPDGTTGKIQKAISQGIPIMSVEQFKRKFKL